MPHIPSRRNAFSVGVCSLALRTALAACVLLSAPQVRGGDYTYDPALSRAIDAQIDAVLASEGLPAAPRADDSTLVRRIYLDLLGRIPTPAESEAYLADASADKHHRLIDRLLVHPELPVYWRKVLHYWLNGYLPRDGRPAYYEEFLAYLQRSLAENKPWDRLARELVLPSEDADQHGASYFLGWRLNGDKALQLDNITTSVASSLFGVQLQCAKCHDHPLVADWKQDHYYGLAAFFGRLERANGDKQYAIREKGTSEVKFVTGDMEEKAAVAMFLDGTVLDRPADPQAKPAADGPLRRQMLAEHALNANNPFFARSIVNRVWKQLLGRGLVEPVDQMHSANPSTHPALLALLAQDLGEHQFDLRRLMAGILHSEAYLRASRVDSMAEPRRDLYAAGQLRPLAAEQLAWSFIVAAGYERQIAARFAKEIKDQPQDGSLSPALRVRWEREGEAEQFIERFFPGEGDFQANASQALYLTFNDFATRLLRPEKGSLVEKLASERDAEQVARQAYLSVLCRSPASEEVQAVSEHLAASADRKRACQDLVWALVTSAEFRFNH